MRWWLETISLWVLSAGLIVVCLGVTIVLFAGAYEALEFVYETVQSALALLKRSAEVYIRPVFLFG